MLKKPRLFLLPCNFVCNIAPYLRCQGDIITQSPGIFYHTFRVIIQQRSLSFNIWVMMIQFMSTGPSAICRSERFESHWDTSFLCVTTKDMRWSSEAALGKIMSVAWLQSRNAKMRCGECRVRWYCSKECQVLHWKRGGHKQECQALLQSAAEKAHSERLANSSMLTWCN